MKILLSNIGMLDAPYGSFLRTFYFAQELAEMGDEVTLLTTQRKGYRFPYQKIRRRNLTIIATPSFEPYKIRKFGYGPLQTLIRIIFALFNRYDIVHADSHRPVSSFPCIVHKLLKGSKFIAEWWDFNGRTGQFRNKAKIWKRTIGPIDIVLEKHIFGHADGVVVLSEFLEKKALEFGQDKTTVKIIWGGADCKGIEFVPDSAQYRSKLNIPSDKFVFMATGVGGDEILEYSPVFDALNQIYEHCSDFVFVKTGVPVSPAIKQKLISGNYLIEKGFVEYKDYQYLLACADTFVLLQEENDTNLARWPNCIGDYLAAGRPIIFNAYGELRHFAQLCQAGSVVIEMDNTKKLRHLLNKLIQDRIKMSNKYHEIRGFAESRFSWAQKASELRSFYSKFC